MNPISRRALGGVTTIAAAVIVSCAVTILPATIAPALALDLRTSIYRHNWTSVYVGGQVGWSQMQRRDVVGLRPNGPSQPVQQTESESDEEEPSEGTPKGPSKSARGGAVQSSCDQGWILYENEKPPPSCAAHVKAPYVSSLRGAVIASNAATGGLHAGALYQLGTMVIGAEGRLDWGGHKTAWCEEEAAAGRAAPACIDATTNWFGAGIAKLGFARGRTLVYGSLGIAVANSETRATNLFADAVDPPTGFTSAHTIYGLAYGGGLSYVLNRNWVLTADYLRYDLSDDIDAVRSVGAYVIDHKPKMTIDMFTARLSYHIGY